MTNVMLMQLICVILFGQWEFLTRTNLFFMFDKTFKIVIVKMWKSHLFGYIYLH